MKDYINSLNTTNTRILVSIGLAAFGVIVCLIGVTWLGWEPTEKQERLLIGLGVVVLTMMGFDVLQFASKRFSDAGLAAAKNPNQPVVTNVATEDTGDTKSAPGSLGRTLERPGTILTRDDAQKAADAMRHAPKSEGGAEGA